jgi:lipoprotein-anchoring transpeptidase ErfK/SrfK
MFTAKRSIISFLIFIILSGIIGYFAVNSGQETVPEVTKAKESYWFMLYRQSNKEELYKGVPGDKKESKLVKTFTVKAGMPGERPTPLPQLLGRKYWLIVDKQPETENPETAPYFLTLDVPAPSDPPYGPYPYTECNGSQCDWGKPGYFGLHGINGDPTRLDPTNPGSSGCIRHRDEDITYLYNLLDPKKGEIRYYIEDK